MGSLGNNLQAPPPPPTSRISTVVPATPRSDQNGAYELSYMDLLMKLHYIRPVFFFESESVQGLTIADLKRPMFMLLDTYSHVSGRIRRSECGRPFLKCNDAGVRIVESERDVTLREWFDENNGCLHEVDDGLVHGHVLGPDLGFSPLVFVKFTWFKCGGLSVGLSWAHVLGDAFSALDFITKWSNILSGHVPPKSLHMPNNNLIAPDEEIIIQPNNNNSLLVSENPTSIKRATIVGEHWLATNVSHVATHSFHVTSKQLHHLVKATSNHNNNNNNTNNNNNNNNGLRNKYFEIISALIWKCVTQIRGNVGPMAVTICTKKSNGSKHGENEFFPSNNGLVLSKIETCLESTGKSDDISELARIIAEKKMVENHLVKKLVEKDDEGKDDFVVYGANLTFVDLEEADLFGVKLNGHKPIMANCSFHGVGDQGVVLVFPAPSSEDNNEDNDGDDNNNGRIVTVSLPVKELYQLKNKLQENWGIV